MASSKEKLWSRACRGVKTLFFVANMLASLLVCAPPLLIELLDLLLPSALLSASNDSEFSAPSITSQLSSFHFLDSLVDLPLISISRSLLILCKNWSCWVALFMFDELPLRGLVSSCLMYRTIVYLLGFICSRISIYLMYLLGFIVYRTILVLSAAELSSI